mgnify:CR=1 FL=1
MTGQVAKWGNSLALRLPKAFTDTLALRAGSRVEVDLEAGRIVILPVRRRYPLRELLRRVHPKQLHQEVSLGRPVGREVW